MDLTYNYADATPQFVTFERHLGQKVYTINFNVEEMSAYLDILQLRFLQ